MHSIEHSGAYKETCLGSCIVWVFSCPDASENSNIWPPETTKTIHLLEEKSKIKMVCLQIHRLVVNCLQTIYRERDIKLLLAFYNYQGIAVLWNGWACCKEGIVYPIWTSSLSSFHLLRQNWVKKPSATGYQVFKALKAFLTTTPDTFFLNGCLFSYVLSQEKWHHWDIFSTCISLRYIREFYIYIGGGYCPHCKGPIENPVSFPIWRFLDPHPTKTSTAHTTLFVNEKTELLKVVSVNAYSSFC